MDFEETVAGVLMDAEITTSQLLIELADVEHIFKTAEDVMDLLLRQPPARGTPIPNLLLEGYDMAIFNQLEAEGRDENNNTMFHLPNASPYPEYLDSDDDNVMNNDYIESDSDGIF